MKKVSEDWNLERNLQHRTFLYSKGSKTQKEDFKMKFRKTALAVALTMSLTVLAGCDQSAKKEVPELKATTQETVQTQATGLRTLLSLIHI